MPFNFLGIPDTGQKEKLRRIHGPARQDHLAAGIETQLAIFAALPQGDTRCGLFFHDDAGHTGVGDDFKIGTGLSPPQKGLRRTPAPSVLLRDLVHAQPLLRTAIKIAVVRNLQFTPSLYEIAAQRVHGFQLAHGKLAALTMTIGCSEPMVVFDPLEQVCHAVPAPDIRACLGRPVVVIGLVPADIDHGVDGRRPAQCFATRPEQSTAIQMFLWFGIECPVQLFAIGQQCDPHWHVNQGVLILWARFDKRDAFCRVCRQPVGQNATGGSGADDDIVVHFLSPYWFRAAVIQAPGPRCL